MKCSFEGCDHKRVARGLCMGHYRQQLRGRPLTPLRAPRGRQGHGISRPIGRRTPSLCSFEGCGRPNNGRGLCAAHRAQKARGMALVPIGAAKRWWWPVEAKGGDA
jgi:hypothetical protein